MVWRVGACLLLGLLLCSLATTRALEPIPSDLPTDEPIKPCDGLATSAPAAAPAEPSKPILALPGSAFPKIRLSPSDLSRCSLAADSAPTASSSSEPFDPTAPLPGLLIDHKRLYVCEGLPLHSWAVGDEQSYSAEGLPAPAPVEHTTKTATRVWDAAIALSMWLDAAQKPSHKHWFPIKDKRVRCSHALGFISSLPTFCCFHRVADSGGRSRRRWLGRYDGCRPGRRRHFDRSGEC